MCRTWAQQQPKVHRLAFERCSNMHLPSRMSWAIGNVCWSSCTSSQSHRFALQSILVNWRIRKSCGKLLAKIVSYLHRGQEEGKLSAEERLRVCELRVRQFQDTLTAAEAAHSSTPQGQWWEPARQICQNRLSVLRSRSHACSYTGRVAEEYNPEEGPVPLLEVNGGAPAAPGPPSLNGSSMDQLLAGLGGNQDGGGAMPFSAADLVSQLSQSGTSAQLLLDALAALPKVCLSYLRSQGSSSSFCCSAQVGQL